jgi:alpha-D-ribose 1-methylphosphonate 5-triphosphate diphosphatase
VIDGTLKLDGETIAAVDSGRSSLPGALDFGGDHVAPGFVELHTDNLERHVSPRPNARWPSAAAVVNHDREIAAAGITTVCNALSLGQIDPDSQRLAMLADVCAAVEEQKGRGHLKADHHLHLRCEVSHGGLVDLLEGIIDAPSVSSLA